MPADYQRGFSWTEIPANPTPAPLIENDLQAPESENRKIFDPIVNSLQAKPEADSKSHPISPLESMRGVNVLQPIQSQSLGSTNDAPKVNGSVMLTTNESNSRLRVHPHTPFSNIDEIYKKVEESPTENAIIDTKDSNLVSKEQLNQLFCGYDNTH
jgi:hypothetical protein